MGCRAPVLPAQDPDRPARPHPHPAPGRRPVGLHQAFGERVRPLRGRARIDVDLGGPRIRRLARPAGAQEQRRRGDRRRRPERRHGLRGDEQRRLHGRLADRGAERQRHVDRPAGRRDERLSLAPHLVQAVPLAARDRPPPVREVSPRRRARDQAHRGIRPRPGGGRHAVRGAGPLLCRADRRPQSRPSPAGAAQRPRRHRLGPDPGPCRDPQGARLRPGRAVGGPLSRRGQLRCR